MKSMPNAALERSHVQRYSVSLIRATVNTSPIAFTVEAATMFVSLSSVEATTRSASATPAPSGGETAVPSPHTVSTSGE